MSASTSIPKPLPVDALRSALLSALPVQASQFGDEPPEPQFLYVPALHVKALSLDNMLVQGIRGSGKSVWWAALQSPNHRRLISRWTGTSLRGIDEATVVTPGFGAGSRAEHHPDADTLVKLLEQAEARLLWRTIIVHQVAREHEGRSIGEDWAQRVDWVRANPEEVDRLLGGVDDKLSAHGRRHLILFDALDRTAHDWDRLRKLLRGLLQVLLEVRSLRAIRAKAFVRPDMLLDPAVFSFPDASKVINNDVKLGWRVTELFALLWQYLGNADRGGDVFREECTRRGFGEFREEAGAFRAPDALRQDEDAQTSVFHGLTGPFMGRSDKTPDSGKKRGVPYTWLPKHLADARGQVSPRSFLIALRHAAEHTNEGAYPFDYKAIQEGVGSASGVRVDEVKEDFTWIVPLMEPLKGMKVPASEEDIVRLWNTHHALQRVRKITNALAPRYLAEGPQGLIKELIELAFCERLRDDRLNIPDVYRVGFGLARKGGLKPVR